VEKWSFDLGGGGWGNFELQEYTLKRDNVFVEDGYLRISAKKNNTVPTAPTFTSARIKTEGKMSFKYGSLEARIKPPDVNAGLWPALWTLGSEHYQVGWPRAGEIDIFEMGQGLAIHEGLVNQRVVSAAHWDILGEYSTYAKWYDAPEDLTQDFHIYRMDWTPERIATFVDDNLIWEIDITEPNCVSCQELHSPHHIMVNMAVGGGFTSGGTSSSATGGASSSSSSSGSSCAGASSSSGSGSSDCGYRGPNDITASLPGDLLVDWVRLYCNEDTVVLSTGAGTSGPSAPSLTVSTLLQPDANNSSTPIDLSDLVADDITATMTVTSPSAQLKLDATSTVTTSITIVDMEAEDNHNEFTGTARDGSSAIIMPVDLKQTQATEEQFVGGLRTVDLRDYGSTASLSSSCRRHGGFLTTIIGFGLLVMVQFF